MVIEMTLMLGKLEANRQALAEMLLYVQYVLNGHSDYQAGDTCLGCLCSINDFHYFRFVTQLNNFRYFSDSSSCRLKKDGHHLACVKHTNIHMDSPPTAAIFIQILFSDAHIAMNLL